MEQLRQRYPSPYSTTCGLPGAGLLAVPSPASPAEPTSPPATRRRGLGASPIWSAGRRRSGEAPKLLHEPIASATERDFSLKRSNGGHSQSALEASLRPLFEELADGG